MSRARGGSSLTTVPPIAICPPVMSSSPAIIRKSVLLPQPDGPTNTTNSPDLIVEVDPVDDFVGAVRLDDIFRVTSDMPSRRAHDARQAAGRIRSSLPVAV